MHTSGALDAAEYAGQTAVIGNRITELRIERRKKLSEDENDAMIDSLKELYEILKEYEPSVEFDEALFNEIAESITVDSNAQLTFRLMGGIELTEEICKKGRCTKTSSATVRVRTGSRRSSPKKPISSV